MSSFSDWGFGKSGNAIMDDYEGRINTAMNQYGQSVDDTKNRLRGAMQREDGSNRTIASSLDEYDKKQRNIQQQMGEQQDASLNYGQDQQVAMQNYVNPYVSKAVDNSSASRVFGSGDATTRAMNTASANNWDTALSQGSAIGATNMSALGNQAGMAESVLTNDANPQQSMLGLNQDWANANLETATGLAGKRAKTEASDQGLFGYAVSALGNK